MTGTPLEDYTAQAADFVGGVDPTTGELLYALPGEQDHHVEFRSRRPDLKDDPANQLFVAAVLHDDIHRQGVRIVRTKGLLTLDEL